MSVRILQGDCRAVLATLPAESVHCCVTSPPYFGLRDYGVSGQIGLEPTPDAYVAELVAVFREVRRVMREDGTLWLNLGDSYAGGGGYAPNAPINQRRNNGEDWGALHSSSKPQREATAKPNPGARYGLKPKDLIGVPWRVAFALQADGWWLRQDIIWNKPNPMPESVTDRCTKAHEYLFLLSKSARYYFDAEAIAEAAVPQQRTGIEAGYATPKHAEIYEQGIRLKGGPRSTLNGPSGDTRNRRSVWTVATQPYSEAHFATFPPALIEPCILAGCPKGGTVLDPFGGAGTTGLVADRLGRNAVLIDLNPEYAAMARERIGRDAGMFAEVA